MNNHNGDDGSRERLLGRITALLWVVVIALAVTFFFYASSFWITLLLSGFLAILVEPLVVRLERMHIPRSISATLVIVFGVVLVSAALWMFYNKAASFMEALPEYTGKIRQTIEPVTKRIQRIQENAGKLNPAPAAKRVPEVRVSQPPSWPSYLARGVGSVGGAMVIAGVVPFLMFFMLIRRDHIYEWLCSTFGSATDVPNFVTRVTRMVRGFTGGNLIVGSTMAAVMIGVLAALRMDGATALGIASGFLNLIPFLGVVLASGVPLLAATLQFGSAGPFLLIALTVIALHLLSANLLTPKFIGSRVNIGPVAATVGMLFWSWLWGGIGLLLAVPLTAFVKLIADCHPALLPISNLLAERPRTLPRWAQAASGATVTRALPYLRGRFRVRQK
ncbi:MAG TPA: AI-2E family transporter [Terriglobales bacterium]